MLEGGRCCVEGWVQRGFGMIETAGSGCSFKEGDLLNKPRLDPAVFIIPNPVLDVSFNVAFIVSNMLYNCK